VALRPALEPKELALATAHAQQSAELHRWAANRAAARHDDEVAAAEMARAASLGSDPFYRVEQVRLAFEHELARAAEQRHLEALGAQMRAAARYASEPEQLTMFARYYELVHDVAFATAFANRAVAADPRCAACLTELAGLRFASGDFDDAVAAQQAAVRRWPDKTVPAEVTARLQEYRCAAARQQGATCTP
jgi:hypothetical protein